MPPPSCGVVEWGWLIAVVAAIVVVLISLEPALLLLYCYLKLTLLLLLLLLYDLVMTKAVKTRRTRENALPIRIPNRTVLKIDLEHSWQSNVHAQGHWHSSSHDNDFEQNFEDAVDGDEHQQSAKVAKTDHDGNAATDGADRRWPLRRFLIPQKFSSYWALATGRAQNSKLWKGWLSFSLSCASPCWNWACKEEVTSSNESFHSCKHAKESCHLWIQVGQRGCHRQGNSNVLQGVHWSNRSSWYLDWETWSQSSRRSTWHEIPGSYFLGWDSWYQPRRFQDRLFLFRLLRSLGICERGWPQSLDKQKGSNCTLSGYCWSRKKAHARWR